MLTREKRGKIRRLCNLASMKPSINETLEILDALDEKETECDRLKAQVEALDRIYEAARGLSFGEDWNNGTHAKFHGYRQKLIDAVADYRSQFATKGD